MLPTLLAVIGLLALGWMAAWILGTVARQVLAKAVERAQERLTKRGFLRASGLLLASPTVISRILYWAILLFFLAAALGAGPVVTNIMASYYASKTLSAGDSVRIAGIEGTVREIASTSIAIDAAGDRVYLPARKYREEVSVLIGANR